MAVEKTRLVILDRDGVINADSPEFIKTPDEWLPIPGSLEAIARMTDAGFTVVVASNQSGLGRGIVTPENLDSIHHKMCQMVEQSGGRLDGIFFCPHRPEDGCNCRKPRPGLFHQIASTYAMELAGVPAVGDSLRDLQAAKEAGANPVLVRTGNGIITQAKIVAGKTQFELESGEIGLNGNRGGTEKLPRVAAGDQLAAGAAGLVNVFDDLATAADAFIKEWARAR